MAGAGVVTTLLTTPDPSRVLSVLIAGVDVTGDVKWDSFTVTDSGASAKGTTDLTIERSPHLLPEIGDQSLIRVVDHSASGGEVFRGFVRARVPNQDPRHPSLSIIADDLTSLLDDSIIDVEYRAPESLQARIGYLWGKYAGQFLSGDLSYVLSVGSDLPAQRFALVSLRNAIEMTLAQASSSADYYLDMLGKLHIFTSETNNAPYAIDADAPGGGEIAPEHLAIEYDSNSYANRVYVSGANPDASLYVQDDAAINAANGLVRTVVLQEPSVTTAEMATALAQMYLGRVKAAKPRGSFITSSPDDGWRAGQNVAVTSVAHGLAGTSYRIARVTTRVLLPGASMKRQYSVEFGGAMAGAGIDGQQPIIAGQMSGVYMLDQLGNQIVSNAATAQLGGIGPAVRRYITSGIYNGDFSAPPPGPDAPIDNTTNPLPYWSFVQVSGTAMRAIETLDTGEGSGRVMRFYMDAGAASDECYIEQLSPITASRNQAYAYRVRAYYFNGSASASPGGLVTLSHQFMRVDGVTPTGALSSNGTGSPVAIAEDAVTAISVVPSDAYFIRVRVGLIRDTALVGTTASVDVAEIRLEGGIGTSLLLADELDPVTYGMASIGQSNGVVSFNPGGPAGPGTLKIASWAALRTGGGSFPVSPTNNDQYYRTDLDMWFFYNGTRWLSTTLYHYPLGAGDGVMPYAVSVVGNRAMAPLAGVSDLWLENFQAWFYVLAGTALSASHKWVATCNKNPAGTLLATVNIDSGASSTHRNSGQVAINALLGTTNFEMDVTLTKTGTPGNLYFHPTITYRVVAT